MKTKKIKITAFLLIIAGIFTACNGKEYPFLSVDKTTITAPAEGGTFTILVSSNGEWTAVVQDVESHSWITLDNASGTNDGVITVSIEENSEFEIRNAAIKISMGSLSEIVLVEQEEAEKPIGGCVPFKPCLCNEEMVLWEKQYFPRGEVWLFKNSVTDGFNIGMGPFIVYNSERNEAFLRIFISHLGIMGQGLVCNFPDFAIEWLNYKNGLRVYVEGRMYLCRFPAWGVVTTFGYVLTRLEKRQL